MQHHLMFDIETLGFCDRAVVTSLSCVPFAIEARDDFIGLYETSFMVKFDVKEQIKVYNRKVDKKTIDFWSAQDKEVMKSNVLPSEHDESLKDGIMLLSNFIKDLPYYDFKESYLWSRGCYFDFPKIMSLFDDAKMNFYDVANPFKIRDVRTYIDILTGVGNGKYTLRNGVPKEFKKHDCISDSVYQVLSMQEIYRESTQEI